MTPPARIFDYRMPDGSRNFADLPETYDAERPQWHRLRDHVAALPGAQEVSFVTDDVTEAWLTLRHRGHEFSMNNQCGDWWLFVRDPACPDEILEEVRRHFAQVTGEPA